MIFIFSMHKVLLFTFILIMAINLIFGTTVRMMRLIDLETKQFYEVCQNYETDTQYKLDDPFIKIKPEHEEEVRNNAAFERIRRRLDIEEDCKDTINLNRLPIMSSTESSYWNYSIQLAAVHTALKHVREYKVLYESKDSEDNFDETAYQKKQLFLLMMLSRIHELMENNGLYVSQSIYDRGSYFAQFNFYGGDALANDIIIYPFEEWLAFLYVNTITKTDENGKKVKIDPKQLKFKYEIDCDKTKLNKSEFPFEDHLEYMFTYYSVVPQLKQLLITENEKLQTIFKAQLKIAIKVENEKIKGKTEARTKANTHQRFQKSINQDGWLRHIKDTDPLIGESYYSYMLRCYRRGKYPIPQDLLKEYFGFTLGDDFDDYPILHSVMVLKLLLSEPDNISKSRT